MFRNCNYCWRDGTLISSSWPFLFVWNLGYFWVTHFGGGASPRVNLLALLWNLVYTRCARNARHPRRLSPSSGPTSVISDAFTMHYIKPIFHLGYGPSIAAHFFMVPHIFLNNLDKHVITPTSHTATPFLSGCWTWPPFFALSFKDCFESLA